MKAWRERGTWHRPRLIKDEDEDAAEWIWLECASWMFRPGRFFCWGSEWWPEDGWEDGLEKWPEPRCHSCHSGRRVRRGDGR